jgi:hypothetical protein
MKLISTQDGVEVDITHCDAGYPPGACDVSLLQNKMAVWFKLEQPDAKWVRSKYRSAIRTAHEIRHLDAKDLHTLSDQNPDLNITHEQKESGPTSTA